MYKNTQANSIQSQQVAKTSAIKKLNNPPPARML